MTQEVGLAKSKSKRRASCWLECVQLVIITRPHLSQEREEGRGRELGRGRDLV